MIEGPTWKLINDDSSVEEYFDIRRTVGNQIIRAYLLDQINNDKIIRISGKLRGPKNEFKDFANFLIINTENDNKEFRILVEAGVYENLRIVGTDSLEISQKPREELIKIFTDSLEHPDLNNTKLIISNDSKIK